MGDLHRLYLQERNLGRVDVANILKPHWLVFYAEVDRLDRLNGAHILLLILV